MAIPLQLGFADYEYTYAKKKTRWQIFLEQMESTLLRELFLSLIRSVCHHPFAKGERPLCSLEVMLRIHRLQQWFTLSDPLMEEMLIDTPCFRRFARIDLTDGRISDENSILNFRHLLEEHQIAEQVLECVNESLIEQGLLLKQGAILDSMATDRESQRIRRWRAAVSAAGGATGFSISTSRVFRCDRSRPADARGQDPDLRALGRALPAAMAAGTGSITGLPESPSQVCVPGLRAWAEDGRIALSQCPRAFLPQPISI